MEPAEHDRLPRPGAVHHAVDADHGAAGAARPRAEAERRPWRSDQRRDAVVGTGDRHRPGRPLQLAGRRPRERHPAADRDPARLSTRHRRLRRQWIRRRAVVRAGQYAGLGVVFHRDEERPVDRVELPGRLPEGHRLPTGGRALRAERPVRRRAVLRAGLGEGLVVAGARRPHLLLDRRHERRERAGAGGPHPRRRRGRVVEPGSRPADRPVHRVPRPGDRAVCPQHRGAGRLAHLRRRPSNRRGERHLLVLARAGAGAAVGAGRYPGSAGRATVRRAPPRRAGRPR